MMLAECWLGGVKNLQKKKTNRLLGRRTGRSASTLLGMGDAVGDTMESGSVNGTCSNAPDKLAEMATMALAWDGRSRINRNRFGT